MKLKFFLLFLFLVFVIVLISLTTLKINLYQVLESEIINQTGYVKSIRHLTKVYCNYHQQVRVYLDLIYLENNVYEISKETFLITDSKPVFYYQTNQLSYLAYFFKVVFHI